MEALKKDSAVTPPNGVICVTGSLYLLGELLLHAGKTHKANS
jgi:hypothetical protein